MRCAVFALLIFPVVAAADDPFACVDPDFADAFLGANFQPRPEYSTELPDVFRDVSVPASLALVGSETSNFALRAVFKSREAPDAALGAAVDALVEGGWRNIQGVLPSYNRGFQSSGFARNMAQLCRDVEPGMLTVVTNESDDRTFVSLSMTSYGEGQTCEAMEARAGVFGARHASLWAELPVLDLPDGVKSSNSGSGGGGGEFHTRVVVETEIGRSSLVSQLGDQVREQGWSYDTSWSGEWSSGSVWSKQSQDGETLIGMLEAYGEPGPTFNLRFGINTAKTGGFANRAMFIAPGMGQD